MILTTKASQDWLVDLLVVTVAKKKKTRIISIYHTSQGKVTRGDNSLISNDNYTVDCGRDAIIWSAFHHIHNLCTCILYIPQQKCNQRAINKTNTVHLILSLKLSF